MKNKSRNLLALLLLLFGCSGGLTADAVNERSLPKDWLGAWHWEGKEDGKKVELYLNIEPERIVTHDGSSLLVRGVIRRSGDHVVLRKQGLKDEWQVTRDGSALRIAFQDGTIRSFERLHRIPQLVRLEPLHLPPSRLIRPDRIREIQAEIDSRFQEEQKILQIETADRLEKFAPLRRKNREFLEQLIGKVGWIDRDRFGAKTSLQAIAIAKHTDDLRLMMTILPLAERDFQQAGKARMYAILYDSVQLDLGRKQRYGTQVQEDEAGSPFVLPLENPDRVDDYLRAIGLPPLDEYRTQISKAVFSGKPVQIRPEDGR